MKKWMQSEFFLPKWTAKKWGWRSITLLSMAVILLIDSIFDPIARGLELGRSAESAAFFLLGIRAAWKKEPPLSVVIAGALLFTLAAALDHRLLKPVRLWISAPVALLLAIFVAFWGRGRSKGLHHPQDDSLIQPSPDPKSTLKL
jgi:hypothetical protein